MLILGLGVSQNQVLTLGFLRGKRNNQGIYDFTYDSPAVKMEECLQAGGMAAVSGGEAAAAAVVAAAGGGGGGMCTGGTDSSAHHCYRLAAAAAAATPLTLMPPC